MSKLTDYPISSLTLPLPAQYDQDVRNNPEYWERGSILTVRKHVALWDSTHQDWLEAYPYYYNVPPIETMQDLLRYIELDFPAIVQYIRSRLPDMTITARDIMRMAVGLNKKSDCPNLTQRYTVELSRRSVVTIMRFMQEVCEPLNSTNIITHIRLRLSNCPIDSPHYILPL